MLSQLVELTVLGSTLTFFGSANVQLAQALPPIPLSSPPIYATGLPPSVTEAIASLPAPVTPTPKPRLTPQVSQPIATDSPTTRTGQRFRQIMNKAAAQELHRYSMGEIMQVVSQELLGSRYKAGLLDAPPEETLIVSLEEFDCVLFVEAVLAIARNIAVQDYSYQTFTHHLQDQRYRDGQLNGYCSRLHYFSEWISNNQQRGTVENLTASVGGVVLPKTLNFMSQNRKSYAQLKSNANYRCIQAAESNLKGMTIHYIPQNQIRQVYAQLQPGDIIATATDIKGLDVTHTGLAIRYPNGQIGLIHASPSGTVKISPDLQTYVEGVEGQIGIIVARPQDPRQVVVNP